jgi:hypothetical protein
MSLVSMCRDFAGVVQNGRFMGGTESGQSRANQGIPRFACNPDLNHARAPARAGTQLLLSDEPAGGSPTGQPTGPVRYQGAITVGG